MEDSGSDEGREEDESREYDDEDEIVREEADTLGAAQAKVEESDEDEREEEEEEKAKVDAPDGEGDPLHPEIELLQDEVKGFLENGRSKE